MTRRRTTVIRAPRSAVVPPGAITSAEWTATKGDIAANTTALGTKADAANVDPGGPPTASQSLRGRATAPYWGPSEVLLLEDFSGKGDGVFDNAAVLPDVLTQAKAEGFTGRKGATVALRPGAYMTSQPIVLPRTGASPTGVVQLRGMNSRATLLQGLPTFPANRALIEWEAVTDRALAQRIQGFTMRLPDVTGVKAVWYKRNGARPAATYNDYTNERLQIHLEDITVEASNRYHEVLFDLEGSVFSSTFIDLYGDPALSTLGFAYNAPYDTLLLRGDVDYSGGAIPGSMTDSPGFFRCYFRNIVGMNRRGGYCRTFRGRLYRSTWEHAFDNGGRPSGVGFDILNSTASELHGIASEGQGETQVRLTRCHQVTVTDLGLGTPDAVYPAWVPSKAYVVGEKVVPTTMKTAGVAAINRYYSCIVAGTSGATEPAWPSSGTFTDGGVTWANQGLAVNDGLQVIDSDDCTIQRRVAMGIQIPFSNRGVKAFTIDANSLRTAVKQFLVRVPTAGTVASEYTDAGASSTVEVLSATTIGTVGGVD